MVNQGKVIDRLLINGMSQVKSNHDDPLSGKFTSSLRFLDFCKSVLHCGFVLMVVGSISKSTLWQVQQNVPGNHFSVPLEELKAKCKDHLSIKYPKEPLIYEPFTKFLDDYLSDTDFLVFNTSQCYYLDGLAPDIMISLPGVAAADAMAMVLFVELKAHDGKVLGNDHNLGQVYEYLLATARCQLERTKFAGILSNFGQNIAVVLTRTDTRADLTHYIGGNMHTILRFVTAILEDIDYHPPDLEFSQAIGPMFRRLGQVSASIVVEFSFLKRFPASVNVAPVPIPDRLMTDGSHPSLIPVKRPKHFTQALVNVEAYVLLEIHQRGSHSNLPYIVMLSEDHYGVGMRPVRAPISASSLSIPSIGSTIIEKILDALTFLHARNMMHHDVRPANLILHGRSAILIDFDPAAPARVLTTHMSGFICTSQDVFRNPGHQYIPKFMDDLLTVVLMVNNLLCPSVYRNFQSMKMSKPGSDEHGRVVALWAALRESAVWGPLVVTAEANRVDELRAGLKALMVTL